MMEVLRVNIGAGDGDRDIEGYENVDRKLGSEAYPLSYEENSIDEIRASHVLEHFSHLETLPVLQDWYSKLKPGGLIKIAVPDFLWVAEHYLKGEPVNVQGYVMGGHMDSDDHHGSIFDAESLHEVMAIAGFERISHWESDNRDASSLPVSLNLMGYKPVTPRGAHDEIKNTVAILSAPRFGPIAHMRCAQEAFGPLRVPYNIGQGAYWHQVLSEQIEEQIAEGYEYIITCDYDTVFSRFEVRELYRLMQAFPQADAIAPVQSRRGHNTCLFTMKGEDGMYRRDVPASEFSRLLTPVTTAHFGLTIFRVSAFENLPKPWLQSEPDAAGRWLKGKKIDADMNFWHRWGECGNTLMLANNIVVGHIEEMITWPGTDLRPVYQSMMDYIEDGIPAGVKRV